MRFPGARCARAKYSEIQTRGFIDYGVWCRGRNKIPLKLIRILGHVCDESRRSAGSRRASKPVETSCVSPFSSSFISSIVNDKSTSRLEKSHGHFLGDLSDRLKLGGRADRSGNNRTIDSWPSICHAMATFLLRR